MVYPYIKIGAISMIFSIAAIASEEKYESPRQEDVKQSAENNQSTLNDVNRLSSQIRLSDSSEERMALKVELAKKLGDVDAQADSDPFLFALNIANNPDVVKKLSENFYFVEGTDQNYVVLEKLTPENIDAWKKAADEIAPNFQIQVASDKKIEETKIKIPETFERDFAWRKYLRTNEGLMYFKSRIKNFSPDINYDIYVAYVTKTDPIKLFEQHQQGIIEERDMDMVMTIQAKSDLNVYSPMGISRTISGAKRMYQAQKEGTLTRPTVNMSILFHVLVARIVKNIYPQVDTFETTPTKNMRLILAQALNPDVKIDPNNQDTTLALKKVTVGNEEDKSIPWISDLEFFATYSPNQSLFKDSPLLTIISMDDLLNLLFPYTENHSS